jgi:hypothetical protein
VTGGHLGRQPDPSGTFTDRGGSERLDSRADLPDFLKRSANFDSIPTVKKLA